MAESVKFISKEEKAAFVRRMRLLSEDVAELSQSIGIPLALSRRADDQALIAALNQNSAFWNTLLSALQTTIFAAMGRIHDSSRGAYFNEIRKTLKGRKSGAEALARFDVLEKAHEKFVRQMVKLRQKVFAHADFDRPLHESFGSKDLAWDGLESYCRKLAEATVFLEEAVLGPHYEPKHNPNLLEESIEHANAALDGIRDRASP